MELNYTKEKLLLIKNINNQVKEFKSKTLDIVYLYETNNNNINLINDIQKLKIELEIYKKIITKRKKNYIRLSFIFCFIYITFLISYFTDIIPSLYRKLNNTLLFISLCSSIPIIILSFIAFCEMMDNYSNEVLCINSFDNLYNNLVYNMENRKLKLIV